MSKNKKVFYSWDYENNATFSDIYETKKEAEKDVFEHYKELEKSPFTGWDEPIRIFKVEMIEVINHKKTCKDKYEIKKIK